MINSSAKNAPLADFLPDSKSGFAFSRRYFLKLTTVFSFTLCFGVGEASPLKNPSLVKLPIAGDRPKNPKQTGFLKDIEIRELWTLFNFIGHQWQNQKFCLLNKESFKDIIILKTSQVPSYLTEYRMAIELFVELKKASGEQKALQILFFETPPSSSIRTYVLSELINLQIAFGGFRGFHSGYLNYFGWTGGVFSDPSRLPYRGLDYPS